jgi:methionine aminopeptidase
LEAEDVLLKNGDVVKIDLGAHIDGCIAVVGHTLVVGGGNPTAPATEGETKVAATDGDKATGTYADVAMAAYKAGQLCLTMIVPGNTNTLLTETIAKVAEAYGVNAVQGVLMHNMKPFVIDGNKCIINKVEPDQNVDEIEFVSPLACGSSKKYLATRPVLTPFFLFAACCIVALLHCCIVGVVVLSQEPYEVYGIDIAMSTGKGKPIERDARTTVFKRAIEAKYALKMKASRYVLSEVDKLYPALPFATSLLTDIRKLRLGAVLCNLNAQEQIVGPMASTHGVFFFFVFLACFFS